jgi:acyl phosphate:glycerol-3-phosphate acyltransferase
VFGFSTTQLVLAAAVIGGAYLVGAFPTGVLLARARGVDLRQVGSGNIGATNVGRALGKRWAILVLLVDAAKGAAPVLVARALGLGPWVESTGAVAAVVGHSYNIFLRGQGGKGVATSLGGALAISPPAAGVAFVLYVAIYLLFRISSLGSLSGIVSFPAALWLLGPRHPAYLAFAAAAAIVVLVRHRENLRRLVRGQELKA